MFIIDKFFEEEEEKETRKSCEKEKEEFKSANRGSSIIEINMCDDSNNIEGENKEKNNNTFVNIKGRNLNYSKSFFNVTG